MEVLTILWIKYPSSYLGATFYHIAVASIQSKLEAQRKRKCLLGVPADCWIFFRTWSNRSHGKRQSISPVSKFCIIKVIITEKIHVLWCITRVILPFYFSWLFMKSANSFDHIIQDIFRDPMIHNLEEPPCLWSMLNFLNNLFSLNTAFMDVCEVYHWNLEVGWSWIWFLTWEFICWYHKYGRDFHHPRVDNSFNTCLGIIKGFQLFLSIIVQNILDWILVQMGVHHFSGSIL